MSVKAAPPTDLIPLFCCDRELGIDLFETAIEIDYLLGFARDQGQLGLLL